MALEADCVYLVESPEDGSVMLALDAKIHDGLIEWFDTTRDRAFELRRVTDEPDGVSVETERARYRLRRLTLELYDRHVREHVTGHPPFATTESLQTFYRAFPR